MNNRKCLYFLVQHRALYLKTCVRIIVAGAIKALLCKTHYFYIADSDVYLKQHKHTQTHTHTHRMHLVFPLQEWSRERTTILRYMYLVYLVTNITVKYFTG